jgi:hypothetical protein
MRNMEILIFERAGNFNLLILLIFQSFCDQNRVIFAQFLKYMRFNMGCITAASEKMRFYPFK